MVIHQGDIYWVDLGDPSGSEPGYRHPHVIVQNSLLNQSRLRTVVVCVLTSVLKRVDSPGNILLSKEETRLPKDSVVNVSQIFTVDKTQLDEYVGTIPPRRVREILEGIRLVLEPREAK
ncbi:MAG: mRNA interferase [Anaerolineaceae bacterium]|nr:MAG: mRNA interferase [Anaerolineaceae bacterium]